MKNFLSKPNLTSEEFSELADVVLNQLGFEKGLSVMCTLSKQMYRPYYFLDDSFSSPWDKPDMSDCVFECLSDALDAAKRGADSLLGDGELSESIDFVVTPIPYLPRWAYPISHQGLTEGVEPVYRLRAYNINKTDVELSQEIDEYYIVESHSEPLNAEGGSSVPESV